MRQVTGGEALKTKYPEQVVMVNAYSPQGQANSMAAGWSMIASGSPRYYAVGIGRTRYTIECIDAHGAFVVSFPSVGQQAAVVFCGSNSGRDVNKERDSGFTFVRAARVNAPLIEGAVANFECSLVQKYDAGDHYIVLGEVLTAHVEEDLRRLYNFGSGVFGPARMA